MKNWRKLSTFLLALSMSVSLSIGVAACGGDPAETSSPNANSSSVDASSSEIPEDSSSEDGASDADDSSSAEIDGDAPVITTQEGYEEDGFTYPDLQIAENFEMYSWNEFELVTEATCKTAGIKQASWTENESIVHQAYIAPRGHTYDNGICACGEGPVYPDAPSSITYLDVKSASSDPKADGSEYKRYELTEGYYEMAMPRGGKIWLSFAVPEPGQYALYTLNDDASSYEIIRYDASASYIPIGSDGKTYIGFPARNIDGVLYSNVTCSTAHWSTSWRATYSLSGKSGNILKFRFVKIDDEPWTPKTVRVQHLAQQINGVTAPEGPENCTPTPVPYESEFFYEEASGYYRMGTPENPGEIIYVAITMVPERMLLDKPFTSIQYELGSNVYLDTGKTTIDGDYLIWDYMPFITGDTDNDMKIDVDNCYQNFVNGDGLYPVNQELYEFLRLYTNKNKPIAWDDSLGAWRTEEYMECAWLAACYYYKNLTPGSKELPYKVDDVGDLTVQTKEFDFVYYSFNYTNTSSQSTITYCTIACDDPMAYITIGDISTNSARPLAGGVLVETSSPLVFAISHANGEAATFNLTITPTYDGSQDDPVNVNIQKGENTVTIDSIEHVSATGSSSYLKYYTFTATESGTLSIASDKEKVLITVTYSVLEENEDSELVETQKTVLVDKATAIAVEAGDVLEIVVGPATDAINATLTVSLN